VYTLRQARVLSGKTLKNLAEAIGKSVPTYCKFEKDPSLITMGSALTICEYLGRNMSEIIWHKKES
jgi:DNA-binding XRE family transcriptional regulator